MKRAQAAVEFLQTYGWAILAIILVVAALYFFGILDFKPSSQCQAEIGFRCTEAATQRINSTLQAGIVLKSTEEKSIVITNYSLEGTTGTCSFAPPFGADIPAERTIRVDCMLAPAPDFVLNVMYRRSDGYFARPVPIRVKI